MARHEQGKTHEFRQALRRSQDPEIDGDTPQWSHRPNLDERGFTNIKTLKRAGWIVGGVVVGTATLAYCVPQAAKEGARKTAQDVRDAAGRFVYSEQQRTTMEGIIGGETNKREDNIATDRTYLVKIRRDKLREILGREVPGWMTKGGGELTMRYKALVGVDHAGLIGNNTLSEDGLRVTTRLPFPHVIEAFPDISDKHPHLEIESGVIEDFVGQLKRMGGQDSKNPDEILAIAFDLARVGEKAVITNFIQNDFMFQRFTTDWITAQTKKDLEKTRDAFHLPYTSEDVIFEDKPEVPVKDRLPAGVFIDAVDKPNAHGAPPPPEPNPAIAAQPNAPRHAAGG